MLHGLVGRGSPSPGARRSRARQVSGCLQLSCTCRVFLRGLRELRGQTRQVLYFSPARATSGPCRVAALLHAPLQRFPDRCRVFRSPTFASAARQPLARRSFSGGGRSRWLAACPYSHRNTCTASAVQTAAMIARPSRSPRVAAATSRRARRRASATRRRLAGVRCATSCSSARHLIHRHEQAGDADHRIQHDRADRLREPGGRRHAGEHEAEREDAERADDRRRA